MHAYIMAFAVSLFVCYALTPLVRRIAVKVGAVDRPDPRKVHKKPVPRMGGLAIYIGFVLSVLVNMEINYEVTGLLLGGTFIVSLGVIDDIYQIPARVKLAGQIAAAAILVLFDIKIEWLAYPGSGEYFYMDSFSVPITLFWVVGMTNALNLIDGLDGLAAGVALIASFTVCVVAAQSGFYPVVILMAALAGANTAFMKYNFNPATVFMGDTGSMFLGYMMAAISVFGVVKSAAAIALLVPALALGLPIIDTFLAIVRRYHNGKPIFQPDRGHLHHRLLAAGLSHKQAVLLLYLVSLALSVSALILIKAGSFWGVCLISAVVTAVFVGAKKIGILNDI